MIRSMFRTAKNKKFNYEPLYYNKKQEEFDRRVHKAALENDSDVKSMERLVRLSDTIREKQSDRQFFRQVKHQRNMARLRLLIIINVLLIIVIFAAWKMM